jgi:hypothetical protein
MKLHIERQRVIDAIIVFFGLTQATKQIATGHTVSDGPTPQEQAVQIKKHMGELGLMLSGGAINSIITGTKVNDLDFYIKTDSQVAAATRFFSQYFKEVPYVSTNAITFKRKSTSSPKRWTAQLITRFKGSCEEILDTFDFTITQGLFDFDSDVFVFGDRFFTDIAARKLVYLGKSRFPICAMYRTKKYQERGYTVPGSTIMHIALSIVRLDIKTYRDLKDQLMGIDTIYLQGLLSQDKYADALPVDYGTFLVEAFEKLDGVTAESNLQQLWMDNISPNE